MKAFARSGTVQGILWTLLFGTEGYLLLDVGQDLSFKDNLVLWVTLLVVVHSVHHARPGWAVLFLLTGVWVGWFCETAGPLRVRIFEIIGDNGWVLGFWVLVLVSVYLGGFWGWPGWRFKNWPRFPRNDLGAPVNTGWFVSFPDRGRAEVKGDAEEPQPPPLSKYRKELFTWGAFWSVDLIWYGTVFISMCLVRIGHWWARTCWRNWRKACTTLRSERGAS